MEYLDTGAILSLNCAIDMEEKGMFRRRGTIRFQGRNHSKRGVFSLLIGILVIAAFIAVSVISGMNQGNGASILGAIGIIAFAISIVGFLLGIKSFKEKDIFYVAPVIGVGSNGIMIIVLFSLYIIGLAS